MERASLVLAGLVLSATLSTAQTGPVYVPGNSVSAPTLVREVKPTYTPEAKAQQIVGWVLVNLVVLTDGAVGDVTVTQSCLGKVGEHREPNGDPFPCRKADQVVRDQLNGRDPSLGLDQQAVKAAKQWTFRPGIRDQRPVAVRITIEIAFKPPPR